MRIVADGAAKLAAINAERAAAVMTERDRRIVEGTVISVAGYGPVSLQGRQVDRDNLSDLAFAASLRISVGAGATLTGFRDKANVIHQLTQPQVVDLWMQAGAYVSAVYESSWVLKDMAEIPADFTDDGYWP